MSATSCARSALLEEPEVEMPLASEMRIRLVEEIAERAATLRLIGSDHIGLCALEAGINRLRARMPARRAS